MTTRFAMLFLCASLWASSAQSAPWGNLLILGDSNVDTGHRSLYGIANASPGIVVPAGLGFDPALEGTFVSLWYKGRWSNGPNVSDYLTGFIQAERQQNIAAGGAGTGSGMPLANEGVGLHEARWHDLPNQVNYLLGQPNNRSSASVRPPLPFATPLTPSQRLPASDDTLVHIQIGGNDFGLRGLALNSATSNNPNCTASALYPSGCWSTHSIPIYKAQVQRLIAAGYKNFSLGSLTDFSVVPGYQGVEGRRISCGIVADPNNPNRVPVDVTPECLEALRATSEIASLYIVQMMNELAADPNTPDDVQFINEDSGLNFIAAVAANPQAFGIDVTDRPHRDLLCGGAPDSLTATGDPARYLYYDCVHLTTRANRFRATYIAANLNAPAQAAVLGEILRVAEDVQSNAKRERFSQGIKNMGGVYGNYNFRNNAREQEATIAPWQGDFHTLTFGIEQELGFFVLGASFDYTSGSTSDTIATDFESFGGAAYFATELFWDFQLFGNFSVFSSSFDNIVRNVGFSDWTGKGNTSSNSYYMQAIILQNFRSQAGAALDFDMGFTYHIGSIDPYNESGDGGRFSLYEEGNNPLARNIFKQNLDYGKLDVNIDFAHYGWFDYGTHKVVPSMGFQYRRIYFEEHNVRVQRPFSVSRVARETIGNRPNTFDQLYYPAYAYDSGTRNKSEGAFRLGLAAHFENLVLESIYKVSFGKTQLSNDISLKLTYRL